jgi:protein ImuA
VEASPAAFPLVFAAKPVPVRAPGGGVPSLRGPSEGAAPEDLHPALWRAHQVGQPRGAVLASGHAELDAVLPGGGWPARALTELLLPHPGIGELRLLAPALAALQAQQRCVMLFDPPALPFAWALAACGLDVQQLYVVRSRDAVRARVHGPDARTRAQGLLPAADVLWALEQSLKSGHLGAALAWLPARLAADALRRLQLAAQAHDGPVFLLRDEAQRTRPSPAPLRLWLRPAGADELRVQLLKRRGPPLAQPLVLALAPVLSTPSRVRAQRHALPPLSQAQEIST